MIFRPFLLFSLCKNHTLGGRLATVVSHWQKTSAAFAVVQ